MWTMRSLSWGARYAIELSCSLYVVGTGSGNVFLRGRCLSMDTVAVAMMLLEGSSILRVQSPSSHE